MLVKIILIFLLAAVLAWLGWQMHQDSGYVLISLKNSQIETSVWTAVLFILLAFIIFYIFLRLVIRSSHWPRQWRRWRQAERQRRAYHAAELGGCALIEESFPAAEQHFREAAQVIPRPVLYYAAAAIAAQAQGANARRESYLRQAWQIAPDAEIPLSILQVKLQMQGQQWQEAAVSLTQLQSMAPRHPAVKRLLAELQSLGK
jgi:HemY protein